MTDRYVATTGHDDTGDGTIGNPWQTLAKAVTVAVAGDTVNFRTGTYTAGSNFQGVAAGSSGSRIIFQRYQNETVTIVGTSAAVPVFFSISGFSYITLDGFIVDATLGLNAVKINNGSHDWIVKNCELKNAATTGVLIPEDSNNGSNLIQNCNIHNNGGTDLDHGVYIENADNVVEGCEIHDNPFGYGIQIYQNGANNLRNIIRRNYTHGNGLCGIIVGTGSEHLVYNNIFADKATIRYGGSCVFANNTVYSSGTGGIVLEINNFPDGIASAMIIENNIIYGETTGIYPYQLNGIAITIRNNLIVHQASDEYLTDGTGSITLTNNLLDKTGTNTTGTYHPNFVSLGADFHIQTGSSARDTGYDASALFTTDYDGNSRPQGSVWDIGAYEFLSNSTIRLAYHLG